MDFIVNKVKDRRPHGSFVLSKKKNFLMESFITNLRPIVVDIIGSLVSKSKNICFAVGLSYVFIQWCSFTANNLPDAGNGYTQ